MGRPPKTKKEKITLVMKDQYLKAKTQDKGWRVKDVVFSEGFVKFTRLRPNGDEEKMTIREQDFESLTEVEKREEA